MYSQLGTTVFENLKTPSSENRTRAAIYAEHALIEGKPRLQRTGLALEEISISIRLHVTFCNPLRELETLIEARDKGEILPLIYGNGFNSGEYVITELQESLEEADGIGNIFSVVVNITLKEYVVESKLQQIQQDNRDKALATGDKKPVATKKKNPSTCPQIITNTVAKIDNHGNAINKVMTEKGGAINAENKAKIRANSSAISNLANSIIAKCETEGSCVYNNDKLKGSSNTCKFFADAMKKAVENNSNTLNSDNTNLKIAIKNLKSAARTLSTQTITRK